MPLDGVKDKDVGIPRGNNRTAADLYEVQPDYERFNQKNTMAHQRYWNPTAAALAEKRKENLKKLVEGNRPGYSLIDWAFYSGATANARNTGFSLSSSNRRGNSWQSLSELKLTQTQTGIPADLRQGKLEADPTVATRLIKKMSPLFGADDVGFCLLDRKWVYSHWFDEETREHYPIKFSDEPGYEAYQKPIELEDRTLVIPEKMKYVIVLIHEMDELGMASAPTLTAWGTVQTTYSRISFTTVMLAEFIRGLGYNAIPSANDTALNIPLAIDAGLGELARNAKLIHPLYGPRCRISKVITDLPLEPGKPNLWGVTEFCNVCGKCAHNCPTGAIPTGERSFEPMGIFNHRGVLQWQVDHMKCYEYWSKVGTDCGICIRVCPFNKSKHWSHNLVRWAIRRKNANIDSLILRADNLLGYGKFRKPDDFWLK